MERTQPEKLDAMKELLEEGFSKQNNGTFTSEYLADYTPKMLSMLKSERMEEVKTITEDFRKHKMQ